VTVDFDRKEAVLSVVADQYDPKALLNALEKEGFQGKVVKGGAGS
jgi:hypothetical protein